MFLRELFNRKRAISFELFPPKTKKGEKSLFEHVEKLMSFSPDFVTCTYGAGGSTQSKTLEIINQVKKKFDVPVASHLTVVGSRVDQLRQYLEQAQSQSVELIVALRGDPPQGETKFQQTEGGLEYANELVSLIKSEFKQFGILVAGYPEKHREAPNMDIDMDNLKRKVDAGADAIVTQLFYDNDDFFRFCDLCEQRRINVPIVPGLLPVTSLQQIQRITNLCGAKLPPKLRDVLASHESESDQFEAGIQYAIDQTNDLIRQGVAGLHFYVLNRSVATAKILESIERS